MQLFSRSVAILAATALSGCIPTPYGPAPVVGVQTRNEYVLFRMTSVASLPPFGDVLEVGEICWRGIELSDLNSPYWGSTCRSYPVSVLLRRGDSWKALSDQRITMPGQEIGAVIPANFRYGANPTFLYLNAIPTAEGAIAELHFMDAKSGNIRALRINANICGKFPIFANAKIPSSVGILPRQRMIVVSDESKVLAILPLPASYEQDCQTDNTYEFEIGPARQPTAVAVFVGNSASNGEMKAATRDRGKAAAEPDHWTYFDGSLPVNLEAGPVQMPEQTQLFGSVLCDSHEIAKIAFICATEHPLPSREILCTYHGSEVAKFPRTSPPPATTFQDCKIRK